MRRTKLDPDLVDISGYNKFQLELFFVLERNGSRSGSLSHTGYLSADLAETSLNTDEGMLEQGRKKDLTGVRSLAQAKE